MTSARIIKNNLDFGTLFLPGGGSSDKTITQLILGWIVFFFLIIAILVVLYVIINIIFKGYSRTFRDLLQWNMSNKVDVQTEFAGKDSALYNALIYFTNKSAKEVDFLSRMNIPIHVYGPCDSGFCGNVFLHFFSVLETYYEPEFGENKLTQALTDYIAYHDRITKDLALKKLTPNERIHKVNFILDGIYNYMDKYSDIVNQEIQIICKLNGMTKEKARDNFANEVGNFKDKLKKFTDLYGVQTVSTNMEFANFFIDPIYIAKCGTPITKIYNTLLSERKHDNYRKQVQKLVKDIQLKSVALLKATTQEQKNTLTDEIKIAREAKLKNEIEMARIRKQAMDDAKRISEQESVENTVPAKQPKTNAIKKIEKKVEKKIKGIGKKIVKTGKKHVEKRVEKIGNKVVTLANTISTSPNLDIITMNGEKSGPLITQREDGKFNKVYVPCYHAYMHYVNSNITNPKIQELLKNKMGKDEIVAYLFLQDLKILQEGSTGHYPPFIVRVLKMHCALENIALRVNEMFPQSDKNENEFVTIRQALMNILLDSGENSNLAKSDMKKYKSVLFEAYKNNDMKDITVSTTYTWYLTELLFMANPTQGQELFDIILQRWNVIISSTVGNNLTYKGKIEYAQRVNAYMNISSFTINNSTGINANNSKKAIDGLKINKEIQNFVSYYPIFSTIYFSCIAQLDKKHIEQKTYDDKITYARRIYNLTCLIMSEVSNDIKFNFSTDFDVSYNNLMHRVHSIKQFFFNAHILHLHFTQYRHIIIERDSMSKTSYEREGFVELYNEQYMDSKEFFNRLITPFKRDFLENRVFNEWKRLFYGPRFSKTSKISYWIEFDAFWIGMLRPKADKMIKNVWNDIAKSAKLRW